MKKMKNFTQIPNSLIFSKYLTNREKIMLISLLSFKYGNNDIFPSQQYLAEKLSVSRETVNNTIRSLKSKKFITVMKRGYSTSNIYTICDDKFTHDDNDREHTHTTLEKKNSLHKLKNVLTNNTELNNTKINNVENIKKEIREKLKRF